MSQAAATLREALNGVVLNQSQALEVFAAITNGEFNEIEIAAFLGALHARGEDPAEIAAAAQAFRAAAVNFPYPEGQGGLVDVVGTGGDRAGTINISTASALVAASLGVKVAKHGNRAVSSRSGAADLVETLGIPLDLSPQASVQLLESTGFCFLFAQKYHPAMRYVAPVRAALKNPTVFNLIGPLVNPAPLSAQVLGVGNPALLDDMASALASANLDHALVVHGSGLDEIALHGPTQVRELRGAEITAYELTPAQLGLGTYTVADLVGGDASVNAQLIRAVFDGAGQAAHRDAIAASAGAVLYVTGKAGTLAQGVQAALEAIANGTVASHLDKIVTQARELSA